MRVVENRFAANGSTPAGDCREASTGDCLSLVNVRENNLKNVCLEIPHDSFTVISGLSGSGKSTLAFDTIYAEGGRRYIETFSPYTRQFLDRLKRPDLDSIHGVRPALALEQRNRVTSSRSTVGTSTEINDYLKLIWSQLGAPHCPCCGRPIERSTASSTLAAVENLVFAEQVRRTGTRRQKMRKTVEGAAGDRALLICFCVPLSGTATLGSLCHTLSAQGFVRYFSPGGGAKRLEDLEQDPAAQAALEGELLVVVDRLRIEQSAAKSGGSFSDEDRGRLLQSITQAYSFGHGKLSAIVFENGAASRTERYSESLHCPECDVTLPLPKPSLFTFNSPLGACDQCHGFGKVLVLDPALCIPDPNKSIGAGAVQCWATPATTAEFRKLKAFCAASDIPLDVAWKDLPAEARELVFNGPPAGKKGAAARRSAKAGNYRGVSGWFEKLQRKRHRMHVRIFIARYRSEATCPSCSGTRLKPQALNYKVLGYALPEIWDLPLERALEIFRELRGKFDDFSPIATVLDEVVSRLGYLNEIGLGYLTLDRQSRTLSGGESQRVNLTSILGSRLVNTMLVLDEPTIGLHSRDTARLINALRRLKEMGNTVVVVEHDTEVISRADRVIDLGPLAGSGGGQVVFAGPPEALTACADSITGRYLANRAPAKAPPRGRGPSGGKKSLQIRGATCHNLRGIDVEIPLGGLTVLTGVSGSGKSTLITRCLYEPYQRLKQGIPLRQLPGRTIESLGGLKNIDDIVLIDQSPLGKTPRSNPATYTKAWDGVRDCLASTDAAAELGLGRSAFSFNVDGGRCPVCKGCGQIRIEMQFLADVFVLCETCNGTRFQDKVLGVRYAGKNVVELLAMTLEDAARLFAEQKDDPRAQKILAALDPLLSLGLGYLRLGQPLNAVSGGEAQRIKLASYLAEQSGSRAKAKYLFILDEPTTGLHPHNVAELLSTFTRLISAGHSVLCIEHNIDVIASADWVIDMGPEGGDGGGRIVASGAPAALAEQSAQFGSSYTAALLKQHLTSPAAQAEAPRKRLAKTVTRQPAAVPASRGECIEIVGARHHNLKNISVGIEHGRLTVVTGVSGSGKSTLAFDILFAEGQRRYIDCLSPYARQYIKQLSRADVDQVRSIPPTIAVSQKTAPPMGVSTIATTTEIYQFLRLLYAKLGTQHCVHDGAPISGFSAEAISEEIARRHDGDRLLLFAPVISGRKGYYNELFNRALRAEITQAKIDGSLVSLHERLRLERHKLHWISLMVASVKCSRRNQSLLHAAVEQCLLLGNGEVELYVDDCYGEPEIFSINRVCPQCGSGYRELDPQDFSFRSARGVCDSCQGRGAIDGKPCPECEGARIGPIGRNVYLEGRRIHELTALNARGLLDFVAGLDFGSRLSPVAEPILHELTSRLKVIIDVGLDYIRLDRDAHSISGGEAQRLRLARSLGSPLTGVCYILDEPSIGLHPKDHRQLMDMLFALRDSGNTVVVVEHDEDTIMQADRIIDVGPGGGSNGGRIVAEGTLQDIVDSPDSLTGSELRKRLEGPRPAPAATNGRGTAAVGKAGWLELRGARTNNLRSIDVRLPIGKLTVVVGVSGAGKSSLVHGTLIPAIVEEFEGEKERAKFYRKTWESLYGHDAVERFVEIDQTPIGRTPTSTPASFLGIYDDIRKIFAQLPEAKSRGWGASHFSFNTGKGRCPDCAGRGEIRVPMSFMPEATTPCETCRGLRFTDETLELLYQGISIGELLQKTCSEAREILCNHSRICRSLDYVLQLGLGYLRLGQPTHTLSGGEAQRIKIARELGMREAQNTIYVLDEPTIGLHMSDVAKLRSVLQALIDRGNTVVVIEHNLDIITGADYLIEIGPGPGDAGGEVLFQGSPQQLQNAAYETPTKQFLSPKRHAPPIDNNPPRVPDAAAPAS